MAICHPMATLRDSGLSPSAFLPKPAMKLRPFAEESSFVPCHSRVKHMSFFMRTSNCKPIRGQNRSLCPRFRLCQWFSRAFHRQGEAKLRLFGSGWGSTRIPLLLGLSMRFHFSLDNLRILPWLDHTTFHYLMVPARVESLHSFWQKTPASHTSSKFFENNDVFCFPAFLPQIITALELKFVPRWKVKSWNFESNYK